MNPNPPRALQAVSFVGLALSVVPAFLVFAGVLDKATYVWLLLIGMLLWFGTAVFWIKPDHQTE